MTIHTFLHIRDVTLWRGVREGTSGSLGTKAGLLPFEMHFERGKVERGRIIHNSQSGTDPSKGRTQLRTAEREIILLTPLLKLRDGAWKCLKMTLKA